MRTRKNEYIKEWNNESLVEHNLTYHSSDVQRRFLGKVDFHSPSRTLIEQESTRQGDAIAIWEDAEDCARKLNFLLIAKEASSSTGIHRANVCAGLHIVSAIRYHCHGETLESIGDRVGKKKQVIGRYNNRFISWNAQHCSSLVKTHTPASVIETCRTEISSTQSLADVLDQFRQQLTDIFHDLVETAERLGQQEIEVYRDAAQYKPSQTHHIDVATLLGIN